MRRFEFNLRKNRLALLWLLVTAGGGLYVLFWGLFAASTFMGVPPDAGDLVEGSRLMMLSGALLALGPLGVWYVRRARPWLWAAAVLFGALEILALTTLFVG